MAGVAPLPTTVVFPVGARDGTAPYCFIADGAAFLTGSVSGSGGVGGVVLKPTLCSLVFGLGAVCCGWELSTTPAAAVRSSASVFFSEMRMFAISSSRSVEQQHSSSRDSRLRFRGCFFGFFIPSGGLGGLGGGVSGFSVVASLSSSPSDGGGRNGSLFRGTFLVVLTTFVRTVPPPSLPPPMRTSTCSMRVSRLPRPTRARRRAKEAVCRRTMSLACSWCLAQK